ncbi:TetR/AcrR family transcriptional regulator [Terrarubrum flagellatum]|uniref:TetR/AcrR family transcriptional regulator n=1 Tax=Terrirubrum flagellatum TaxID=2895980 RepID=UPI0031456EEE
MTLQAPLGRPASSPTDSAQSRLLALAEEEIRRQGFKRMRVVAIAEAAGMTHANVYRYFPSRLALADAVTVGWLKPVEAALLDAATAADPAVDKLERMALALAQAYRDRLEQDANLFALFADAVEKARPVARKHRARTRELIGRVVEEALGEDSAGRAEREKATNLLFDAGHRFLHPTSVLQDKDVPRSAFNQRLNLMLEVTLRYFRTRLRIDGA